jgi:hypothetical protein
LHDGHHETKKLSRVNWNAEFCGQVRKDLDVILDGIEQKSEKVLAELPKLYGQEFRSLLETMESMTSSHLL